MRLASLGTRIGRSSNMRSSSQSFSRVLEALLEQLAIRTEDGKLIYQDILCMSWAGVCDQKDHSNHKRLLQQYLPTPFVWANGG